MSRRRFSDIDVLVSDLLDRYEKNPGATRWTAPIDNDGFGSIDERDSFDEEIIALEELGGIERIFSGPKTDRVATGIKLRDAEVLYRKAGRQPAALAAADALAKLRAQDDLPPGIMRMLDEAAAAWGRNTRFMDIVKHDAETLELTIRLALAAYERLAGSQDNEIDFRTFSRLAVSDSKALERNLGQVAAVLSRIGPVDEAHIRLDPEEMLANAGIRRLPQPVLIHGPVALDNEPFPAMSFVGIPIEDANRITLHDRPAYLLTIENFTSFVRYVREIGRNGRGLVIYSGGFPSRPALETIARLAKLADGPVYHWGDMDAGGVRIFRHIERRLAATGIALCPHMMDADLLRQFGKKPEKEKENSNLGDMTGSAVADLAHAIGQTGLAHEQEEFDPQCPLDISARAVRPGSARQRLLHAP